MTMKKALFILLFTLLCAGMRAQTDSLYVPASIDSTLLGKDIIGLVQKAGGKVTVTQSAAVRNAFQAYTQRNSSRPISGYRIRVFYDNDQKARNRSEAVARSIAGRYPGLRVYRTFESPNFKVSVGDFRSKDEALRLFNELKVTYPASFIIKENINYPLVDAEAIFE
jgi:hypothetical protein